MIVKLLSVVALLSTVSAYAQTKSESKKQSEKEGVNEVMVSEKNRISVIQKGNGNTIQIDNLGSDRKGSLNKRTKEFREGQNVVVIETTDSTLMSGNSSSIVQSGSGNTTIIKQSGGGNHISVSQSQTKKE